MALTQRMEVKVCTGTGSIGFRLHELGAKTQSRRELQAHNRRGKMDSSNKMQDAVMESSSQINTHPQGIQKAANAITQVQVAGEKKHVKSIMSRQGRVAGEKGHVNSNTSGPSNFSLHDCKDSANVMLNEEGDILFKELTELGLGEDMSDEEFFSLRDQLCGMPPRVDTSLQLDISQQCAVYERHALYCIRALKDGFENGRWDEYRELFYSYEIDQEYANYCKELNMKLKWLEDYGSQAGIVGNNFH